MVLLSVPHEWWKTGCCPYFTAKRTPLKTPCASRVASPRASALARLELIPDAQQGSARHLLHDRRNQYLLASDFGGIRRIREHLLDVANGLSVSLSCSQATLETYGLASPRRAIQPICCKFYLHPLGCKLHIQPSSCILNLQPLYCKK